MTNELSVQEAQIVKALLIKGHKAQDIAALYGVNSRAISQVKHGECYRTVEPNFDHGLTDKEITTPKIDLVFRLRNLK